MKESLGLFNFDITPATGPVLAEIERQSWLVGHMLLMPKHETWIRREVQIQRAVGTTRIGGAILDESAVRSLVREGSGGNPTEDEQANINAFQAYEFVDFLSDQADIPIDELVIRQLNRYFMYGAQDHLTPGVYRKGQTMDGNYSPPDQGEVPKLLRSLLAWLQESSEIIHPVAKAGMAHIQLLAIHPFWDGNGRTARALATLILQRSVFGFKKLLSFERHMSNHPQDYSRVVEQTLGTQFAPEYDATSWLEFFILALRDHANELVTGLTEWHRQMEEIYSNAGEKGWIPRQTDGLVFAFQAGRITRPDYIAITGVSPITASRDLAEMVESGMLLAVGNTRGRVYYPVRQWVETRQEPPDEQLPLMVEG